MIYEKLFRRVGIVEFGIVVSTLLGAASFLHFIAKPLMFPSYSAEWHEIVALGLLFSGIWWIFIGRCVAEIRIDDNGISIDYPLTISLLSFGVIQLLGKPRPFFLSWPEIRQITVRSLQDGRIISADIVPSYGGRRTVIAGQYPHGMIDAMIAIAQEKQKEIVQETMVMSPPGEFPI